MGVADRIFARVGASDDLARGRSTFMVEMTETARILNTATARSLVILDEIGRGTSTYDGVSLAWSTVEYLHDQVGCRTLFATHYHELTDLAHSLAQLKNLNVAVREWQDDVVFLHKIIDGPADKSYGIHVARLAGVPREVLERAKQDAGSVGAGTSGRARRLEAGPPAPRNARGRFAINSVCGCRTSAVGRNPPARYQRVEADRCAGAVESVAGDANKSGEIERNLAVRTPLERGETNSYAEVEDKHRLLVIILGPGAIIASHVKETRQPSATDKRSNLPA